MLYRLLIIVLLILAELPVDAATLKGVILANELSGLPMENVGVDAISGTNLTISDLSGKFTLEFPERRAGDTVRIIVKKEGYVVVNDVQLETVLPADVDAVPLTVILAKEGDREEMAQRFYRLKSSDAIEETYRKRVKELEDTQQATGAAITKLRQERDQAKAAAEKAAEQLAKIQPGQSSELYKQAKRLFLDGKIDEAINLLDDEELRQLVTQAKKDIDDAVQAWLLKGQLLTVQFRFEDAEKAYKAAIDAAPDSFEAHFAYARFNQELNRYRTARTAYDWCLDWARRGEKNIELAVTLNNLGLLDRDQNRMEEARKEFEEALKVCHDLAQKNPGADLPHVALTLNNLGLLDRDQNRMEEARKEFEEALRVCRDLAQKNPEVNLPEVALALNNLGMLDRDQNRMEEARKEIVEALKIRRELAQKNPNVYLPDVAQTLNNLGLLDHDEHRMEEARKEIVGALEIRRELAQKNPDVCLPDVARTLNDLGLLDHDEHRMEEARKEIVEALEIRRGLAQKNPDVYLPDVAQTFNNLGILDRDQNRMQEARNDYAEALKIRRELAQKNPDVYLPKVARTLNNLGILDRDQGRMEEARNDYAEALEIRRELAQKNPDVYLPDVAQTLNNLGLLDRDQNRMEEAGKEFAEALQTYRELAQKNPNVYLSDVAQTLNNLGLLDRDQNRMEEAGKEFAEALAIFKNEIKEYPEGTPQYITAYVRLVQLLAASSAPAAGEYTNELARILQQLRTKVPPISKNEFTIRYKEIIKETASLEMIPAILWLAENENPSEAYSLFLRAAQLGDSYAMMKLGRLYLRKGTEADDEEGLRWLEKAYAAPKPNLEAGAFIADCYLSGKGTTQNVQKAEEIVTPLANQSVVSAMTLAGRISQYRAVIKRSEAAGNSNPQLRRRLETEANDLDRQARRWWERAEKDDWNASAHLGKCYEEGLGGVERNEAEAEKRYKAGASHGNALSMFLYGLFLEKKPERKSESAKLIAQAAERGFPSAVKWCKDNNVPFQELKADDERR